MQKGIFRRYFTVFLGMILISIVTLGAMLLFFSSQYFRESEHNMLDEHAKNAANLAQKNLEQNSLNHQGKEEEAPLKVDRDILSDSFRLMSLSRNVDIMLLDSQGKALISTSEEDNFHIYRVPQSILNRTAKEGFYKGVDTLGKIYNVPHYFVAYPIKDLEDQNVGVVIATSSTTGMSGFLKEILKMFLFSSAAVLLISAIIIYFVTKRIVKPLKEMSEVAQAFGKGDFTRRVSVTDNNEVGQLALAFNNMASSLSVNEVMHRSFVANVSHELKTPMTTIGGFIDGILDGTIPQEKQSYYLKIVSDEVKRLSRLVVSMLNIARIEAGEMKINPANFNMMDTIFSVLFSFEQKIEQKNIEIRGLTDERQIVVGDQDLIHQVVYNLLDNAIKFTPENGYIEFSIYTEEERLFVGIKNSGAGIPKEQIEHIFDRFYKTDKSRSFDKKGVGLGLYIVKNILNLHGGEIMVRSKVGEFSQFIFSVEKAKLAKDNRNRSGKNKGGVE